MRQKANPWKPGPRAKKLRSSTPRSRGSWASTRDRPQSRVTLGAHGGSSYKTGPPPLLRKGLLQSCILSHAQEVLEGTGTASPAPHPTRLSPAACSTPTRPTPLLPRAALPLLCQDQRGKSLLPHVRSSRDKLPTETCGSGRVW